MSEQLIRLAYVSRAEQGVSRAEVERIIASARRNNPEIQVTGVLIYRKGQFLQVLEGPELNVDVLIRHIRRDPSHRDLVVVSRTQVTQRAFGDWSMGFSEVSAATTTQGNMIEAVIAGAGMDGPDQDGRIADLIESFKRGLWELR